MLTIIRKRLKLILWTLVVSFVLWEIGAVLANRQGPSVYAGTLYGRPVPVQEFQAALDQSRQLALLSYGERAARAIPHDALVEQAWDLLLLSQAARRAGIRVGDREVIEELTRWPLFQRNGQFDVRTYQTVVQYGLGTTPRMFEEGARRRLAVQKLLARAVVTPAVSDEELDAAWRAEHEAARFAYLVIDPSLLAVDAAPSEAQVLAYHQQHAGEFQSDPTVRIRYVAVRPEAFEPEAHVSDADILEEYLRQALPEMRGSWPTSDRRAAIRRQLVSAKAKGLAAEIAGELRDGWTRTPDLQALAAPYQLAVRETPAFAIIDAIPEIPSSRTVADAAFQLPVGEMSRVIETPEAYYLLTVLEKTPAQPLSLSEAAPQIRQRLRDQTAQQWARERAENLFSTIQELALANIPNPLAAAAKSTGLTITTTDFVTRSSPLGALGTADALLGPAFLEAEGRVPAPWQTAHGWVLAQRLERRPPDQAAFASAKDSLRTQLAERKRAEAVTQWLSATRAEAKPRPNPALTR